MWPTVVASLHIWQQVETLIGPGRDAKSESSGPVIRISDSDERVETFVVRYDVWVGVETIVNNGSELRDVWWIGGGDETCIFSGGG